MASHNFDEEADKWRRSHLWADDKGTRELYKKVRILEERLNNIQPTEEQMDKYPSLRSAFEQFIIIKKLTTENDK